MYFAPCAYKRAWPVDEALGYISDRAGIDFCSKVAEALVSVVRHGNAKSILAFTEAEMPDKQENMRV